MIDPDPFWPEKPGRAQVRAWELLLFQIILGLAGSVLVLALHQHGYTHFALHDAISYTSAIHQALGVAMIAFVIRDEKLGPGARFAPSGRLAMVINALGCGTVALFLYENLLNWGRFAIYDDDSFKEIVVPCICITYILALKNCFETRGIRPILRWVPLAFACLQIATFYFNL